MFWIKGITNEEATKAENYIKTYGTKTRYMTRPEMSKVTGLSDEKCKKVMKALTESGVLHMLYAISCPICGKLVDKGVFPHVIHKSGYVCPYCKERVEYDRVNFCKLYAPHDTIKREKLKELVLKGGEEEGK